jgi:glycerophosphoryl diester phosphodiesterase
VQDQPTSLPIGDLARATLRRLRWRWKSFVVIQLATDAVLLLALTPLVTWLARWLITRDGQVAISNEQLVGFFLSWQGLSLAVLVAVSLLVSRMAQVTAVLSVLCVRGRFGIVGGVRRVVAMLPTLVRLAFWEGLWLTAGVLPGLILAGWAAWPVVAGEFDVNYYLVERPPTFWWSAAGVASGLLLAAIGGGYVLVKTSLALPIVLFDESPPRVAICRSRQATRGIKSDVAWLLTVFVIAAAGASLVVGLVTSGLTLLAGWFGTGWWGLIVVLLLGGVQLIVAEAVSLLVISTFGVLLALLYERVTGQAIRQKTETSLAVPGLLRWRGGIVFWTGVGLFIVGTAGSTLIAAASGLATTPSFIIAHRGDISNAPENSLLAFEHALDVGADLVELDVQLSADGVVVVIHDEDLMRVAGVRGKVAELSASEIATPTLIGSDQTVPTLRQALQQITPRGRVLIELKYYGFDKQLVPAVLEVVDELGVRDRVLVMSLKVEGVRQTRRLAPDVEVGLTIATSVGDLTRLDVDFLALSRTAATPETLDRLHQAGIAAFVWTVDDPSEQQAFLALGADGLITDAVPAAVETRSRFDDLTGIEQALVGFKVRRFD